MIATLSFLFCSSFAFIQYVRTFRFIYLCVNIFDRFIGVDLRVVVENAVICQEFGDFDCFVCLS